jgi:probable HAF family extracellular repeat protein
MQVHLKRPRTGGFVRLLTLGTVLALIPTRSIEAMPHTATGSVATTGAITGEPEVRVVELPRLEASGGHGMPEDINDHGQIVGTASTPSGRHAVLWDRHGRITDLGPSPESDPPSGQQTSFINDRGQVATQLDGHAVLWERGQVTDLNGDARRSAVVALNERGQVLVWRQSEAGVQTLLLWHRGTFTEIATSETGGLWGLLSNRGHVVVRLSQGLFSTESYIWHRGIRTDPLVHPGTGNITPFDVNRFGQVVGTALMPTWPYGFVTVLWDDGESVELPRLGAGLAIATDMNDRGQIVGLSPGPDGTHAVLWEDGEAHDIGAALETYNEGRMINERGDVIIEASVTESFFWRDGRSVPLPGGDPASGTNLEISDLNDRGQVVGWTTRLVSTGEPGLPRFDIRPVLWEVRLGR